MSELFREIEEDIKRERFDKLWKSVGRIAVWGSIAVIAATTVYVIWDNHNQSIAQEKTSQFIKGEERMKAADYKAAAVIFSALADDDSTPYYAIAMLHKAQAQELAGDKEGSAKTYAILAKKDEGNGQSDFAELAELKSLKSGDTIKVEPTSPFYYTVAERNAWQLLQAGKKEEAASIFASLTDIKAPPSIAARAIEALRLIAPEKLSEKGATNE